MPVVRRMVHPLLFLLARSDHTEMARQIQFLKEENRILRSKLPRRITVTKKERMRLVRLGLPLGSGIERLIRIVSPRTFGRWVKGFCEPSRRAKGRPGRPRTLLPTWRLPSLAERVPRTTDAVRVLPSPDPASRPAYLQRPIHRPVPSDIDPGSRERQGTAERRLSRCDPSTSSA